MVALVSVAMQPPTATTTTAAPGGLPRVPVSGPSMQATAWTHLATRGQPIRGNGRRGLRAWVARCSHDTDGAPWFDCLTDRPDWRPQAKQTVKQTAARHASLIAPGVPGMCHDVPRGCLKRVPVPGAI